MPALEPLERRTQIVDVGAVGVEHDPAVRGGNQIGHRRVGPDHHRYAANQRLIEPIRRAQAGVRRRRLVQNDARVRVIDEPRQLLVIGPALRALRFVFDSRRPARQHEARDLVRPPQREAERETRAHRVAAEDYRSRIEQRLEPGQGVNPGCGRRRRAVARKLGRDGVEPQIGE